MKIKNHVDPALAEFAPGSVTVRVAGAIFGSVPFAPKQPSYDTVGECFEAYFPQGTKDQYTYAYKLAVSSDVERALWIANAIDTGDTGIAIYSGVTSALSMVFGNRSAAFDTDSEQGVDTAIKLLGLGYMVHKLFPGSPAEKVSAFYTAPAGQALGFYFAAIDVALPFADNLASAGGNVIQSILGRHGAAATQKISKIPGGAQVVGEAQSMLGSLIAPLEGAVRQVSPYARSIADATARHLPGAMSAADKVAGVVATGADVLPMYRYLGARLAAESCVLRASRGA